MDTIRTNYGRGLSINLEPFRTIKNYVSDMNYGDGVALRNILGNIIPFVPLGFIIPVAFPSQRNIIKTMCLCLLVICGVEIFQLVSFLGSFDIDDIILNQISCVMGFIMFILFKNVFKKIA